MSDHEPAANDGAASGESVVSGLINALSAALLALKAPVEPRGGKSELVRQGEAFLTPDFGDGAIPPRRDLREPLRPDRSGSAAASPLREQASEASAHIERIASAHEETLSVLRQFSEHLRTVADHQTSMLTELRALRSAHARMQIQGLNRFRY